MPDSKLGQLLTCTDMQYLGQLLTCTDMQYLAFCLMWKIWVSRKNRWQGPCCTSCICLQLPGAAAAYTRMQKGPKQLQVSHAVVIPGRHLESHEAATVSGRGKPDTYMSSLYNHRLTLC